MWIKKEEVPNFIPHRDPFLFIDSVEKIELSEGGCWDGETRLDFKDLVNSKITAHYETVPEHPIFKGHFPGRPILPGVIQIEIMAQAGAFTLAPALFPCNHIDIEVAFLSVSNAKFRAPVYPGMKLLIEVLCTRLREPMISHTSKIFCSGNLVSEASTLCSIKSKKGA